MRPISPRIDGFDEIVSGEDEIESDCRPMVVGQAEDVDGVRVTVTRWTFTKDERAAIAAGEDLYLWSFAAPDGDDEGMTLTVGPAAMLGDDDDAPEGWKP